MTQLTHPRILFRHIAKTGGTTLLSHFSSQLGKEAICVLGPHNRCKRFFSGLPQIEELNEDERDRFRVIQGHGVSDEAIALMQDPEIRLMVVLREPVALVKSRFNQRFNAAQRKDLNVSPDFFMRKLASNSMARSIIESFPSLVDSNSATVLDQAKSILRKFDYVFTTEGMSTQLGPMLRVYGMSEDVERKRIAEHKEPLPVSDAEIEAINEVDLHLHSVFSRPVDSDGHSYNALGFDSEGKRAAIAAILEAMKGGTSERQKHCYEELAEALCKELRGTAALAWLDSGQAVVADPAAFRLILKKRWAGKEAAMSDAGKAHAGRLARQLARRIRNQA
jgi:hypothetical protein